MKKIILLIIGLGISFLSYSQGDSLRVFFYGNVKGERFKVYWEGRMLLKFKSSASYKYSFKIPREKSLEKDGLIEHIMIYRKGVFGLRYRDLVFQVDYEPKKYLIIWRNPMLKNWAAVQGRWSDKEPIPLPEGI